MGQRSADTKELFMLSCRFKAENQHDIITRIMLVFLFLLLWVVERKPRPLIRSQFIHTWNTTLCSCVTLFTEL